MFSGAAILIQRAKNASTPEVKRARGKTLTRRPLEKNKKKEAMEEKSSGTEAAGYESPSLEQMLSQAKSNRENPEAAEPEAEVATETKTEVTPEVEKSPEPKPEVAPETPKVEEPPVTPVEEGSPKPEEKMVPLSALKAERERRRAADAALAALRAQGLSSEVPIETPAQDQTWGENQSAQPAIPTRSNFELLASEKLARLEHSDYDEKYKAFEAHAAEALKAGDRSLVNSILASDHPGEAAYVAGKMLLEGQKYGYEVLNDPEKYRAVLRQDLEKEIRAELGAKEKSTVQSRISDRSKTPTDIGLAKAASGSSTSEYQSPSMAELLAQTKRSRKRF